MKSVSDIRRELSTIEPARKKLLKELDQLSERKVRLEIEIETTKATRKVGRPKKETAVEVATPKVDEKAIFRAGLQGKNNLTISRELGIPSRIVKQVLNSDSAAARTVQELRSKKSPSKNTAPVPAKLKKLTASDRKQIDEMIQAGYGIQEISDEIEKPVTLIAAYLDEKQNGTAKVAKRRGPAKRFEISPEKVLKLKESSGKSVQELAEEFGCSVATISARLREAKKAAGIEIKRGRPPKQAAA